MSNYAPTAPPPSAKAPATKLSASQLLAPPPSMPAPSSVVLPARHGESEAAPRLERSLEHSPRE
jgi:hypothetical protein